MTNKFEQILICIDDSKQDENVLEFTSMIARAVKAKKIHLLHVTTDVPYLDYLSIRAEANGGLIAPDLKNREESEKLIVEKRNALGESAKKYFGDIEGLECQSHVLLGSPLWDNLRFAKDNDIDLIVLGRHLGGMQEKGDTALLARRITRKATCSVLTIPENFKPKLKSIIVPVRDSECSAIALQTAFDLGQSLKAEILAVNLFHIYSNLHVQGGYAYQIVQPDEALELAEKNADEECKALLKRVEPRDVKFDIQCLLDKHHRPVDVTTKLIKEISADLVVIGARGRTGAAGVLLGTVTEQLIKQCSVPLLATKKKGECLGVLKAMLSLFE